MSEEKKEEQDYQVQLEAYKERTKAELAGVNRRNSELERERAELVKQVEDLKALQGAKATVAPVADLISQLRAREAVVSVREKAITYAKEKNLDLATALALSTDDWTSTQFNLDNLERMLNERAEVLSEAETQKRFAGTGKPQGGDYRYSVPTWADLCKMPDGSVSGEIIDASLKAALNKGNAK